MEGLFNDDDMKEQTHDKKDEDIAGIIINTHLETMSFLGSHIFELSLPTWGPLPTTEEVEQGCDCTQHFTNFLKVWGAATVGSFNFLSCGCLVYWSNHACYIRPCRDQHTEPIGDLSQKMYDNNPEHYGDTSKHPIAFDSYGKVEVDEQLLGQLFNMEQFDEQS